MGFSKRVDVAGWMGICWPASLGSGVPADTGPPKKFLGDYCVKYHGTKNQKGDIWLDELIGDVVRQGARWSIVADQIRRGEMPPHFLWLWNFSCCRGKM